jgi:ATP-dependent protease ClpP protease subunit
MDQIEKHTDRDHFMSAAEAQEYHIIDRVISKMGVQ